MDSSILKPASELAGTNKAHFPNESVDYRRARQDLLTKEIELRRQIERVAELRRALPPGGEVKKNYVFEGENGKVNFADLFDGKQTLAVYSYMFGPQRQTPCPMCTSFMSTWEHKLPDIEQRIGFVFIARSPIARLIEARRRAAGRGTRSSLTSPAITRATMSAPRMPTCPATACSHSATARSDIFGPAR